ncbi:MAG: prepilin-type N-terminal cleavage/methylation domain-containing protein [bacterium]
MPLGRWILSHPRARSARGLTLLEIMLSLAITALVVAIVYGSLRTVSSATDTLSARNELYRMTYAALEDISRELASAYAAWNGRIVNGRGATYFYVEGREEEGMHRDDLFFTTYGHAASQDGLGESDQSEVCYRVVHSDKRDELILLKKEDWTIDERTCRDEGTDWNDPYEQSPFVVATGIHPDKGPGYRFVGFQVEPFQNPADEEGLDKWNSTESSALPSRVRVTLSFEDSREEVLTFSSEVLLRLGGPIQIQAGTTAGGGGGGGGGEEEEGGGGGRSDGGPSGGGRSGSPSGGGSSGNLNPPLQDDE